MTLPMLCIDLETEAETMDARRNRVSSSTSLANSECKQEQTTRSAARLHFASYRAPAALGTLGKVDKVSDGMKDELLLERLSSNLNS